MTRRITLVSHAPPDRDDRASDHLARLGYALDWKTPCAGDQLGALNERDAGTVVFGGRYCISELADYPFLRDEIRWLKGFMDADLPVLGICQGAQMIAHILGGDVGPHRDGRCEFGYYPVEPTDQGRDFLPRPLHMAQAHSHQFQIPKGARHLARSALFENQAFAWGDKVYGLQFHPEITPHGFRRWQGSDWYRAASRAPGAQLRPNPDLHNARMDGWFRGFLDALFGPAG